MGGSVRSSISSDRARSFTFRTVGAYYSNVMQAVWPRLALRSYGEGANMGRAKHPIHFQHPAHANHLALRVLNEPQETTNITLNNSIYKVIHLHVVTMATNIGLPDTSAR